MESVCPSRVTVWPSGFVTVTRSRTRDHALSPLTVSSSNSCSVCSLAPCISRAALSKRALPNGGLPTTVNTTSSVIKRSVASTLPCCAYSCQRSMRSLMARSSCVMFWPALRACRAYTGVMKRRASVLLVVAAVLAVACEKPKPPQLTPRSAQVSAIRPESVELTLVLDAHNPNAFPIVANRVSGIFELQDGTELGRGESSEAFSLPAQGDAALD